MTPRIKEILRQTIRFVFVGILNTIIDFGIFNLLADYIIGLQTSWTYFACKSIAFIFAMTNSFFLNSRFTFKEYDRKKGLWWRFAFITVATFVLSSGVSTEVFHLLRSHTSLSAIIAGNASVVVSVLVGMFTNFIGYKFFVFKDHEEAV